MSLNLVPYSSLATSSPHSSEDELLSAVEGEARADPDPPAGRSWRNLAAFWLLGLCNNYAYVIMLSAAHDILGGGFHGVRVAGPELQSVGVVWAVLFVCLDNGYPSGQTPVENDGRDCNPTSTGAILLADILPALAAKTISPAVNVNTHIRVMVTVLLSAVSFVLVAASVNSAMAYTGVVCASLSSGIGEVTFLAYTAHFQRDVVSTWSSGTGFSGVLGSFSYAALIRAGLSPRNTLFSMLVCPAVMAFTYGLLLRHPASQAGLCRPAARPSAPTAAAPLIVSEKVALLRRLPIFMVPLGLVYTAEYFINQGLLELIWFRGMWLSHSEQYRWLQVVYQIGVFISRSSVNVFQIRRIWILTVLQCANAAFFLVEAYWLFVPSFWLIVALVLWEGLLGGAAYVNTFYTIYQQFPDREREFILGTVTLADSLGIAVAGAVSLPVHDALCRLPGPRR